MSAVFTGALLAILVVMAMALVRAVQGPTVFDRILAVNMFGTKTVLLICVAGFAFGVHAPDGRVLLASRPEFLDLALVYGLVNFIGTIAVLKFVRFGNLASDADQDREA